MLEKKVSDTVKISIEHPDVAYAKVTVDKTHALRFADSVSLTLEHHNEAQDNINYLEKAS
jgi:D-erythro-7,8-dihydroneopterin triphosphate epimerase